MQSTLSRKRRFTLLILVSLAVAIFCFRHDILVEAGSFLITESPLEKTDAIVILGGKSYDRGIHGASLFHDQWASKVICTGGNTPTALKAIGIDMKECDVTRFILGTKGVDLSEVASLNSATSTFEEAEEIKFYTENNNITSLIIVSSEFHLRRVRMVFKKVFKDSNVKLFFSGAPSSNYTASEWWKSEEGLIMVNNEYVKLMYYVMKY